jgi:hypothetical protein
MGTSIRVHLGQDPKTNRTIVRSFPPEDVYVHSSWIPKVPKEIKVELISDWESHIDELNDNSSILSKKKFNNTITTAYATLKNQLKAAT